MIKLIKLMNGILIGSFLICISTDSVVNAEEVPTEILSEPVNDARDSKDKLIEVLNKASEPTSSPEVVGEDIEGNNPVVDTPEQNENVVSPTEYTDVETKLDTNGDSEVFKEEADDAGVSNEENTDDNTEEPIITEPEVPTEEDNNEDNNDPDTGDDDNTDIDNGTDTSTPEEPGEDNNEPNEGFVPPSSEINDLDDKVKDAFKPIEMPEEPTYNTDSNMTSESKGTSKQESKTVAKDNNTEKKVTKYNIDRLPETGITDNIELIYIFEIVILGFALLLLSFKPVRKSNKK